MEKSIISKGKNVQTAVDTALELLEVTKRDVNIEIIEIESKGLLGIGSKPAVVRVTVNQASTDPGLTFGSSVAGRMTPENTDPLEALHHVVDEWDSSRGNHPLSTNLYEAFAPPKSMEDGPNSLLGKAWVLDGQIFCKDAPDQYALIRPSKGMVLYKNEEPVTKTVVINEDDILKVQIEDEIKETTWELKMDESKMQVTLFVTPGFLNRRRLKDHGASQYIELTVEEIKEPSPVEKKSVLAKLKELGVIFGIRFDELAKACETKESGTFVIACGEKPLSGTNGSMLPMYNTDSNSSLHPKERPDGTIDFREIREFPSVKQGQIVGVVKQPEPGKPGKTVTGEMVPPAPVFPATVVEGKGVALVEKGSKVVATEAGQPSIENRGTLFKVSIVPKLTHAKDVNLESGNIHFIGDVEITGSVQDGMLVEAEGNALIHDNVNMAKIRAKSSIIVHHNLISSELTAGKSNLVVTELSQILGDLVEQMKKLVGAIIQISQASAFKMTDFSKTGLGPLMIILLESKFKQFHRLTLSFLEKIEKGKSMLDEPWLEIGERLHKAFIQTHTSELKTVEDLIRLTQQAEELYEFSMMPDEHSSFIRFDYAHNSLIHCSGDIAAVGQGCYNSKLFAGGVVQVDGFVRGGEIYAGKGAKIGEAGTNGGTFTRISVPRDQSIRIQRVTADTVIQIGTKAHKFTSKTSNVYARLNEEGVLKLH
jgi:predicted RNA-binding protein Jag